MQKISNKILILSLLAILIAGISIVLADDDNGDSGERGDGLVNPPQQETIIQPATTENNNIPASTELTPSPALIKTQSPKPINTPSPAVKPDNASTPAINSNAAIIKEFFGVLDANRNGIDDKYENLK